MATDMISYFSYVETANGHLGIIDVRRGDMVYTIKENSKRIELSKCVSYGVDIKKDLYDVQLNDGKRVWVSEDQEFLTPHGKITCNNLIIGEELYIINNDDELLLSTSKVTSVDYIYPLSKVTYLKFDDDCFYFVNKIVINSGVSQ